MNSIFYEFINIKHSVISTMFVIGYVFAGYALASGNSVINFQNAVATGFADIEPSESLTVDLSGYLKPADATLVVLHVYNNLTLFVLRQAVAARVKPLKIDPY